MTAPTSRPQPAPPSARLVALGLAVLFLGALALACDGPARTPRPSPSLITLDFTPQPSRSSVPSASPGASLATWPLGWDESFCAMFASAVDAQQLLVDVQLDINDGHNHDARLLADELTQAADDATGLINTMPEWSEAQPALVAIAGLMDLGSRAGTEYHSWFANGKQAALRRAMDRRTQNSGQVPEANNDLADLAAAGLACTDMPLVLEAPG